MVALLLYFFTSALLFEVVASGGFDKIPNDIFKNAISPFLLPGSLARLGKCSTTYNGLSSELLDRYKVDGQYDIPQLLELYHTTEDECERSDLKRLIEANLQDEIEDSYTVRSKYELCKKDLFTDDFMTYDNISGEFPNLSMFLLNHKGFIYKPSVNLKGCCSPILLDTFIGSVEKISARSLQDMFQWADPDKLWPLFDQLDPDTSNHQLTQIFETQNMDFLLDEDENINFLTMLYILTQTSEGSEEFVLAVLEKYGSPLSFAPYIPNFMQYKQLKPVVRTIVTSPNYPVIETRTAILDCIDSVYFAEHYFAFRGEKLVKQILEYLGSFSDGKFGSAKPEAFTPQDAFEVALIFDYSEALLFSLMSQDSFYANDFLIVLALKRGLSAKTMTDLLGSKVVGDFFILNYQFNPIRKSIDMEVFKLLGEKLGSSVCLKLFRHIDTSIPRLQYLKHIIQAGERSSLCNLLSWNEHIFKGVDSSAMIAESIRWLFDRGYDMRWELPQAPPEVVDFLKGQDSQSLAKYISKEMRTPIRSSWGLAAAIMSKRQDGLPHFQKMYFEETEDPNMHAMGTLILMMAQHKDLNPWDAADTILDADFDNQQRFIFSEIFENGNDEYYGRVIDAIRYHRDQAKAATFLGNYLSVKIERRCSKSNILLLKHIDHQFYDEMLANSTRLRVMAVSIDPEYYQII